MRRLFQLFRSVGGSRGHRPARPRPRPSLEALEDRLPLSSCHIGLGAAGHFGGGAQHSLHCGSGASFSSRAGHRADCGGAQHSLHCGSGASSSRAGNGCHGTLLGHHHAINHCGSKVNHISCPPPSTSPPTKPPSTSPASISGTVYADDNGNGMKDAGEMGLPGVAVTLTGTDSSGNAVSRTTATDANGLYSFTDLPPSSTSGYTISRPIAPGFSDGTSSVGTVNGVSNGMVGPGGSLTQVVLHAGDQGINYSFGEVSAPA